MVRSNLKKGVLHCCVIKKANDDKVELQRWWGGKRKSQTRGPQKNPNHFIIDVVTSPGSISDIGRSELVFLSSRRKKDQLFDKSQAHTKWKEAVSLTLKYKSLLIVLPVSYWFFWSFKKSLTLVCEHFSHPLLLYSHIVHMHIHAET